MKKEKLETLEYSNKKEKQKKETPPLLKVESVPDNEPKEENTPSEIENLRSEIKTELGENKDKELNDLKEMQKELMGRIDDVQRESELFFREKPDVFGWFKGFFKKENNENDSRKFQDEIGLLKNELEKVNIDINELEK